MRKLLLAFLAVLLIAGAAFAVSMPQSEDPKNGPQVTTVPVYSASAVAAGDIVVWDIGSSTGDNDSWIATTTTADTHLVAGVVYPAAIAAGDTGTIAVRGVVPINVVSGHAVSANSALCTSTTAGQAKSVCSRANGTVGFVTEVSTGSGDTQVKGFVNTL